MKHISILIPEGDFSLSNLEATYKMFTRANDALLQMGKAPLCEVHLVSTTLEPRRSGSFFSITPELTLDQVAKTDLIIIPAVHGSMQKVIEQNAALTPWILKHYKAGAEVASLCIGAFILATTGLLKGKSCATHWLAANEFRAMFPEVNLVEDRIITDEQGIYSSGGAYSSLNLILYLIEKFAGRDMALLSSKVFEIDIARNSQSPFIIFNGQKDHNDENIKLVQKYIEQHYTEKISVEQLAERSALSRRSFERRFKKATTNTVIEYIQRVKMEAAKKSFESTRKNINEVMYEVGYSDTKAFRDVFKKITGMSPIDYRNRYNKDTASVK